MDGMRQLHAVTAHCACVRPSIGPSICPSIRPSVSDPFFLNTQKCIFLTFKTARVLGMQREEIESDGGRDGGDEGEGEYSDDQGERV